MKQVLTEATLVGEAMAKVNDYEKRDMPLAHYVDGPGWEFALCLDISQEAPNYTELGIFSEYRAVKPGSSAPPR